MVGLLQTSLPSSLCTFCLLQMWEKELSVEHSWKVRFIGVGVLHGFGADLMVFSGSSFNDVKELLRLIFGVWLLAHRVLVRMFLCRFFCVRIFGAQMIALTFRRFSSDVLVLKKGVPESRKGSTKSAEKSVASECPCHAGCPIPFPLCWADSTSHNGR